MAFTSGDAYRARWELLADGRVVDGGEWDLPAVAPWSKQVVALPTFKECAGERFFNVYWELKEKTAWAERGFCLGKDQVALTSETRIAKSEKAAGRVTVEKSADAILVADARLEAAFSRKTGTLSLLEMDGRTVLSDVDGMVAGPRLGMNRAFADKDGKGVRFAFDEPAYFQALHYDCEDLMFARHRRAEHRIQNIKPLRRL